MIKYAILLTCYNRKSNTLACLKTLFENRLSEKVEYDVFLVDDGSTDGTTEAVKKAFPKVHIIQGTGSLFWNQGMRLAWNTAIKHDDYDFYVWLNDDTLLHENALEHLLSCHEEILNTSGKPAVITGACMESETQHLFSYGGRTDDRNVVPNGTIQSCEYINGNIVLIPNSIFRELGVLSDDYTHGMGDYDYGLRAKQKGFLCYTTKQYIAVCPTNKGLPVWCNPAKRIKDRLKAFNSPLGLNIKEYTVFRKKFWPRSWLFYIVKAYVKMLLPAFYIKITKK